MNHEWKLKPFKPGVLSEIDRYQCQRCGVIVPVTFGDNPIWKMRNLSLSNPNYSEDCDQQLVISIQDE